MDKYIIEVRDLHGRLDSKKEAEKKKEHPQLFGKKEFTIDALCYYMSFGQGRDNPSGPRDLPEFMKSIGLSYRRVSW